MCVRTHLQVMHPVRTFLDPFLPLRTGTARVAAAAAAELSVDGASEWYPDPVSVSVSVPVPVIIPAAPGHIPGDKPPGPRMTVPARRFMPLLYLGRLRP